MAPLNFLAVALAASVASAFAPAQSAVRKNTQLHESFGLGGATLDMYDAQPDLLKGEQEYKQYMNRVKEDNLLNEKYNVIARVRELELLQATIDNGILAKLEKNGLTLEKIEQLLPLAEKFGLLGLAANNQQLLANLAVPLVIEGAPILLPVVAGALETGPSAFYIAAAGFAAVEGALIVGDVEVPFIGLPASAVLGLVLVPLSVASAVAGTALASLKK